MTISSMDNAGNLYGTTYLRRYVLRLRFGFQADELERPMEHTPRCMTSAAATTEQIHLAGRLVLDANGEHGTASGRGASIYGVIFEIARRSCRTEIPHCWTIRRDHNPKTSNASDRVRFLTQARRLRR